MADDIQPDLRRSYQRLRIRLSSMPLMESLTVFHAYFQYLQFGVPLPEWIETTEDFADKNQWQHMVLEWELDVLCREILIHGSFAGTRNIADWDELAGSINVIKEIQGNLIRSFPEHFSGNIAVELFRMAHQQFPWQRDFSHQQMIRYLKIFGSKGMNEIVTEKTGMPMEMILRIALGCLHMFYDRASVNLPVGLEDGLMSADDFSAFLGKFALSLPDISNQAEKNSPLNQDFLYAQNPLVVHPLIIQPKQLICPIPTHLMRRCTQGIYYEVYDAPEFSQRFGESFQSYVGEVLSETDINESLVTLSEQRYGPKKARKDTVDWIVSDGTAHLFVECKTKRPLYSSKAFIADVEAFATDIDAIASAVAQVYKSLVDALTGKYPHWQPDGKPIYPMVVFLEDWYAFGPLLLLRIKESAVAKLGKAKIDASIIDSYPFTITSIGHFEAVSHVLSVIGIGTVMSEETTGEQAMWEIDAVVRHYHPKEWNDANATRLFESELARIHPELGAKAI